jgi:hypothetical protein
MGADEKNGRLDQTQINEELIEALDTSHTSWKPEQLRNIFSDEGHDAGSSITPVRVFFETLATYDIPEEALRDALPELLDATAEFFIQTFELWDDEELLASLPPQEQTRQLEAARAVKEYFELLAQAQPADQIEWALQIRRYHLDAKLQVEHEAEGVYKELLAAVPEDLQSSVRDTAAATLCISRAEWIKVAPAVLDETFFSATDAETEMDVGQLMQRGLLGGLGGIRTFPSASGKNCAVTILDTGVTYENGVVRVAPLTARAASAQRHEAAHLMDWLEGDGAGLVKMGFREDIIDIKAHRLLKPNESYPGSAFEEGWAVYFQLQKDESGLAASEITSDYWAAYEVVKEVIEYMGLNDFLRARMEHNVKPVLDTLKELDPDGVKLARLEKANKAINRGLVSC